MNQQAEIIANLKQQQKRLLGELGKVNKALNALSPIPSQPMQWKDKILDRINTSQQFIQTIDILQEVLSMQNDMLRKRYANNIAVTLNNLCKTGTLKSFTIKTVKGDFYGLPSWFDENGKPKAEFISDKFKSMYENLDDMIS